MHVRFEDHAILKWNGDEIASFFDPLQEAKSAIGNHKFSPFFKSGLPCPRLVKNWGSKFFVVILFLKYVSLQISCNFTDRIVKNRSRIFDEKYLIQCSQTVGWVLILGSALTHLWITQQLHRFASFWIQRPRGGAFPHLPSWEDLKWFQESLKMTVRSPQIFPLDANVNG